MKATWLIGGAFAAVACGGAVLPSTSDGTAPTGGEDDGGAPGRSDSTTASSAEACSTGPVYDESTRFKVDGRDDVSRATECTPHCGAQLDHVAGAYHVDALPSGRCTTWGERCVMPVRYTCSDGSSAGPENEFECECDDGEWSCVIYSTGTSSCPLPPMTAEAAPTFAPMPGTYTSCPQTVTISAPDPDATIFYTTDGTTPNYTSPIYMSPITVDTTVTIRAIAASGIHLPSDVVVANYVINLPGPPQDDVDFTPPSGTTGAQSVTLHATYGSTPDSSICYTLDGSTPTCSAGTCGPDTLVYGSTPIDVSGGPVIIKAIGCMRYKCLPDGHVTEATYSP